MSLHSEKNYMRGKKNIIKLRIAGCRNNVVNQYVLNGVTLQMVSASKYYNISFFNPTVFFASSR